MISVGCASSCSSIEIEKEKEKEEQQQQQQHADVIAVEDDHNNNNNVFRSPLPDIPISNHLPLHSYCFHRLSLFSHRPCLISSSSARTFSFADTLLASRQAAAGLSALGVSKGDVFMILLPNSEHFVFCFLAASFLGAVVTPANPFFTPAEISKQLSASNARLVVTHSHCIPKLLHLNIPGLKIITVDHHDHTTNGNVDILPFSALLSSNELPDVDIHPDDAVALPFSSGTTGLPKGVVLTHKSIITSVAQQVDGDNPNLHLTPHDVFLCVLPLFHIFALNSVLLCSLRAGAAVLLVPKFHMDDMMSLIQRHRVSVAAVVPPLVLALAKNPAVADYDLSSIRLVLSGAAPLGKDLLQALQSRVPQAIIGQGYGMTEAGPVVSMCLSFAKQPTPAVAGCCGTVVRNAELIVVEGETGRRLGRNEAGEICVRGDQIMKGYLNNEEATEATIDSRGFLHTGDIGYVDQHDQLFIVDRLKELIKFKGFQVAPAEIEALLLTHPGIADAAAVPQHDEVAGEVPVAFVVRSNSCECDEVTEESVKEFIAKQVVFYKNVHHVYFVESIPKSPSGKILRKNLRAKLLAL